MSLQTICTFTDGALVQHQTWDGKESTITRKVKDGKLVVVSAELLGMWACSHGCHSFSGSVFNERRRFGQKILKIAIQN